MQWLHQFGLDVYFTREYLKAAVLISLLSVSVLVGLSSYLNRYTKRRYFTIWTVAWLFYALWITLTFGISPDSPTPVVLMLQQWCIGVSAVFLLWGSQRFRGERVPQGLLAWFLIFLLVWSYIGAFHLRNQLQLEVPLFTLMGISSVATARNFLKYRRRYGFIGATLLAVGFLLWGGYMFSFPFLENSGDLTSVTIFISAMIQLFLAVSMIVLVLEEARATQKTTEERYRTLFEQAGEAIVVTTVTDLRILETNRAAERLLGITTEEAAKHSFGTFCRLKPNQQGESLSGNTGFEAICRQRSFNLVSKSGVSLPVEVAGAHIQYDGEPAFQFFLRQLTERARLEQQLRQSEKLSALGQMISGIAHELNNPLAVVKGYLELVLAHHELSQQTRADLEKAARESNRAAKLVGNFLSFAREQPAHREMVDFNEVIRRIAELRKSDFLMAKVEPRLELESRLPKTSADPDQVQQVLMNLITNALQAMGNLPSPGQLVIQTFRNGNSIYVVVEDNGPGVPDELVSKVFEPFFTTKEVGTGTGLGLSIAHSIMTEHGGRLFYEKAAPKGARFVLEFPIVAGETAAAATTETVFITREERPVPSAKVLVVDDEKALAEMLSEMLGLLGHAPTVSHSAVRALELLDEQKFDLVISDFRMPVLTGQQFYESAVKEHPAFARRFIFLTGDVMNEETQSFLRSTGNPHMTKPFNLTRVKEAVSDVLGRNQ